MSVDRIKEPEGGSGGGIFKLTVYVDVHRVNSLIG